MKVTIENFQSIAKAHLTLTGLSVIVGPSNHGKSAVLRAIEGALFNRPGEHIVRKGAKNASVTIDELPGAPYVVWTKGAVNRYQIEGVEYSRVGTGAPQPLQDAGYRDVWVGDVDKKKGESIRPQVGEQFDPLFLLTRSSGFIADVLGLMSRHHVVATAQDRCATDLRSAKQTLGVRRSDLEAVDEKLNILDVQPVIGESYREGLQTAISNTLLKLQKVRHGWEWRRRLLAIPSIPTPTAMLTSGPMCAALEYTTVKAYIQQRRARAALPTIPKATVRDVNAVLAPAMVAAGIRKRRLLAKVTAPSFKPLPGVVTGKVQQLRALVEQRASALDDVYATEQAVRASADAVVEASAALDAIPVCPTCGAPLST